MKHKINTLLIILSTLLSAPAEGVAQDMRQNIFKHVELHGFAQATYTETDAPVASNSFELKRVYLIAKVQISDRWKATVMHDFCSKFQEYYTEYQVTNGKELSVQMGQFKSPITLENPLAPFEVEGIGVNTQAVGYLIGGGGDGLYGLNLGRDLGVMVKGDLFNDLVHYDLAVMNGQGINVKDGNSKKDIVGGITLKPIPGLKVAVSGQKGYGHAIGTNPFNPGVKAGDDYTRNRISTGAEYRKNGFKIRGEYISAKDGEVKSQGWDIATTIPVAPKLDIVAVYDYLDKNKDMKARQTNLLGGVQYWFHRLSRVQLQYMYCMPNLTDSSHLLQAQVQFAF